ncbi:MAG: hypothetical protein AB7E70_19610 [Hyphomicrobiaceae bacterium]
MATSKPEAHTFASATITAAILLAPDPTARKPLYAMSVDERAAFDRGEFVPDDPVGPHDVSDPLVARAMATLIIAEGC